MILFFKNILKSKLLFFLCPLLVFAQYPPDAGLFPLDVKRMGMGNAFYINNIATTCLPEQYTPDYFPNIDMAESGQKPCCSESGHTFAGTGIYTLMVGGKRGSPIFSRGHGWRADGADIYGYE